MTVYLGGAVIEDINLYKIEYLASMYLSKELISDLCAKFDSFSELIKTADVMQEAKILKYASLNKLNSAISIFCLKNHHGYKDRQEIDSRNLNVNREDDGSITKEEVRDFADSLRSDLKD